MNRRDFMKYCAGTALLAAVAPRGLIELPEEIPVGSFPVIANAPWIWRELIDLWAYGIAERSEVATITVARKNGYSGMLLKFAMNAQGGYLRWVPRAGEGIIDLPEHPLTCFTDSPNVRVGAIFMNSDGTREWLIGEMSGQLEALEAPQSPRLTQMTPPRGLPG